MGVPVNLHRVHQVIYISVFCLAFSFIPFFFAVLQKSMFGPAWVRFLYAVLTGLSWPCFASSIGAGVRLLLQARLPLPAALFPWRAHAAAAALACAGGVGLLCFAQTAWAYGMLKADQGWRVAGVMLALWGLVVMLVYAIVAAVGVFQAKEFGDASDVSSSGEDAGDVDVVSFQHEIVEMENSRSVWPNGEEEEQEPSSLQY